MFELSIESLIIIAVAMIAGGIVKGIVGIGLPIVVIAILSNFLEVRLVLALVVVPILLTNGWQALHMGNPLTTLRRFWPMTAALVVGVWLTTGLVAEMRTDWLYGLLGVIVVIFTVSQFVKPAGQISPKNERWLGPLAGGLGGIMGGISTIWGPPMMMYMMILKLPKDEFIRVVGLVWFAGSLPLVLGYMQNGILTKDSAIISAAASIPAFAGLALGTWLRSRIDQETFRRVLLFVLFIIGLNLIRRAIF